MTVSIKYFLAFIFASSLLCGQVKIIKPVKTHAKTTNFAIGIGAAKSVLFLNRNVKENNDANGLQASLIYGGSNIFRFSLEYTRYQSINIAPTWYDIKANTIEANMHIMARFKNTDAIFYPLFGLSYNSFSGYFTGKNDFLNIADKHKPNQTVVTKWLGVNIGTGYEIYFKKVSLFIDYKMRVGYADGKKQLNIMDVCFSAGLRYNLKVPSVYQLFRGTRSRYLID
jgi:hypothetical protein